MGYNALLIGEADKIPLPLLIFNYARFRPVYGLPGYAVADVKFSLHLSVVHKLLQDRS